MAKMGLLRLIAFVVIAIGIVYQVVGDYQAADSIWRKVGDPGFGSGYSSGHDTTEFGDLIVLVGGFAFIVVAFATRRVRVKYAALGLVMMIVPPPFFWPAAGVLMLVVLGLTTGSRLVQSPSGARPQTIDHESIASPHTTA